MAFPTMLFNSSTGDNNVASGAGPATALNGSVDAFTRNAAGELRLGFFSETQDFSGVATDGSAVVYVNNATAGARNFSAITAIKNTRQTGTDAAITTGTNTLTVGSTAGWTTGDVIKIAGAGAAAADLYTTITVTGGTTATTADNAGTTVGPSAAWENPKQCTLATGQGMNTANVGKDWAIGGKRLSLFATNSVKLFTNNAASGDAMEGWIMEMESGYTETRATVVDCRRVCTQGAGCITLRGASGAGTRPIITFSNNSVAFQLRGTNWVFRDFEIQNSNATKTASIAFQGASGGTFTEFDRLVINNSTNKFWKAFHTNSTAGWYWRDCDLGFCANVSVDISNAGSGYKFVGCWIHDCTSHGIASTSTSALQTLFDSNLIESNGGDGIRLSDTGAVLTGAGHFILNNTIANNGGDAVEITVNLSGLTRPYEQIVIHNNIFANNTGNGINYSGTGWDDAALLSTQADITYNDFFGNANPLVGSGGTVLTLPSTNQTVDPQFVDQANADYRIGTNLAGLGFPGSRSVGDNQSLTTSSMDIGVSQRVASSGAAGGSFAFS